MTHQTLKHKEAKFSDLEFDTIKFYIFKLKMYMSCTHNIQHSDYSKKYCIAFLKTKNYQVERIKWIKTYKAIVFSKYI